MAEHIKNGGLQSLSTALADAVERAGEFTVGVNARRRLPSSGVIWSEGIIVTADHTIERDEDITVTLADGTDVQATIAGRDPGSDLAVLRAATGQGVARRAGEVRAGRLVIAVGRSGGERGIGASFGIVSAIGGAWRSRSGGQIEGIIRPDITMYPGFSGGPLVDVEGALVGINTSAFGGNALTIPAAAVSAIVDQLLQHGRLKRGYLGVTSQPVRLPEAVAGSAGQDVGLLIVGVEPDSPAAQGGLMIGDILIAIGSEPVSDTDNLRAALGPDRAGHPTTIRVARGGEPRDVNVTIGER